MQLLQPISSPGLHHVNIHDLASVEFLAVSSDPAPARLGVAALPTGKVTLQMASVCWGYSQPQIACSQEASCSAATRTILLQEETSCQAARASRTYCKATVNLRRQWPEITCSLAWLPLLTVDVISDVQAQCCADTKADRLSSGKCCKTLCPCVCLTKPPSGAQPSIRSQTTAAIHILRRAKVTDS